jgi:CheY-like chemotaxis protein
MRVLLVEDHEESRQVLGHLLEHWGFEVAVAGNLQNALSLIETDRFDAIVSDISLPDGSGYALASAAKRREQNVIAIALSGYGSSADIEIGKLSGFDHHLTKPCDCQQLRSILEQPNQMAYLEPPTRFPA